MLTSNQIKHISALRLKKFRDEYREFTAEGSTLVLDLIRSSARISGIYADERWISDHLEIVSKSGIPLFKADARDMERISSLSSPSPVLALLQIPPDQELPVSWPEALSGKLSLALEGISDPGNLGTLIRIADWFGIGNVICSQGSVEIYNPKVVQASMGSIVRVKVHYTDLATVIDKLEGRIPVFGAFLEGDDLNSMDFGEEGLLVIGSESHGISRSLSALISRRIYIPPFGEGRAGRAESLNAAVAAGIIIARFRGVQKRG
jgi:TrmH family RNA methyltransferase